MNRHRKLMDIVFTAAVLIVFFVISLIVGKAIDTDSLIPAIFALAVFLISLFTDGIMYGIIASLLSVLALNYAFAFTFFKFNFSIPENMVIEYELRKVAIEGREIKLTQTEYNIVELLSTYAGRVLTYSEIIKNIWGYSDSGSIKKLQVNMVNIRKKFGERSGEYLYILNELGVGYRMNADSEED